MQIQKRSMGWIQKPSAYQYSQQLNQKRRAQAQSYLNQQTLLSGSIFAAKDNMAYGMTEIALKAVAKKLQDQARAKIDAGLAQIDEKRAELAANQSSSPLPTDKTA
jgi:hypothetical protein